MESNRSSVCVLRCFSKGLLSTSSFLFGISGILGICPAWAAPSASPAPQSQLEDVKVPCTPDGATTTSGNTGLRVCSVVIPDATQDMESRVRAQIDSYYQGCDLDTTPGAKAVSFSAGPTKLCNGSDPTPAGSCVGVPQSMGVCNVASGKFSGNAAELECNHVGTSCGVWTYLHVKFVQSGDALNPKIDTYITPDALGAKGTREDAYTRGAWVQAVTCFEEQVKQEVTNGHLKLTKIGNEDGETMAMARDFIELDSKSHLQALTFEEHIKNQPNAPDIQNCTSDQNLPTAANDPKNLRQSACLLKSARAGTESMFKYLAVSEVFVRARLSYENFLNSFFNPATAKLRQTNITNSCMNVGKEAAINQCYQKNYLSIFQKATTPWWPTDGSCRLN